MMAKRRQVVSKANQTNRLSMYKFFKFPALFFSFSFSIVYTVGCAGRCWLAGSWMTPNPTMLVVGVLSVPWEDGNRLATFETFGGLWSPSGNSTENKKVDGRAGERATERKEKESATAAMHTRNRKSAWAGFCPLLLPRSPLFIPGIMRFLPNNKVYR